MFPLQSQLIYFLIACTLFCQISRAEEYSIEKDISYYESPPNEYAHERCKLDIYYPIKTTNFATIVWFHGGGLRGGQKKIPTFLKSKGIAIVTVNYRLFPKARCPEYIEDSAAAVAWTFSNIKKYGGSEKKISVSGHSAGGYLTSMIGLDQSYLKRFGINANDIAGLIPLSGHTITHFTPREEKNISDKRPIIDKFAPLYHVRKDAPPLILITGDRELELLGRFEENAYLERMMKVLNHKNTELFELQGFNHGGMVDPGLKILIKSIKKILGS